MPNALFTPHWDFYSIILYVFLGLLATWAIQKAQKTTIGSIHPPLINRYYSIWCITWTIIATFRVVQYRIGGADSINYITYFQICFDKNQPIYFEHFSSDILFRYLNQVLRLITDDYHFYFFIIYGLMAITCIWFINEFTPQKNSSIPFILTFFFFLRGFVTIRSHLAIVMIMIALLMLAKDKNKLALTFAFSSVLFHKSGLLFAMVIPFCLFFNSHKLSLKLVFALIFISIGTATTFQSLFLKYTENIELGGSYQAYASGSIGTSFFDNAWKIAFEQILLGAAMLASIKPLKKYYQSCTEYDKKRFNIIWLVCYYDFIVIPINYVMSIWRGYEYFYLPRLVMWSIIVYIFINQRRKENKGIISLAILTSFIAWMIFRINQTWEDSSLMPYIFKPALNL